MTGKISLVAVGGRSDANDAPKAARAGEPAASKLVENGNQSCRVSVIWRIPVDMTESRQRERMHAAGRRCPDWPAASYQPRRGQPGKLSMAPGIRCRMGFPSLQHFHQRDK
jgi:hypothetical protein